MKSAKTTNQNATDRLASYPLLSLAVIDSAWCARRPNPIAKGFRGPVRTRDGYRSGALLSKPDGPGEKLVQPDLPLSHPGRGATGRNKLCRRRKLGYDAKASFALACGPGASEEPPPFFGPLPGHGEHIELRFGRQAGLRIEPSRNPDGTSIIGGCRE